MPLIQNQVVTSHNWLTMNEFTDLITIAEMTPGPIAVKFCYVLLAFRIAGIPGALIAYFRLYSSVLSNRVYFGICLFSL